MINLFKGHLTYYMAALAVFYGLSGLALAYFTPEYAVNVDTFQSWGAIWAGLSVFGIRRALPGA